MKKPPFFFGQLKISVLSNSKNTFPNENIGDIERIELRVGICNHNRFENFIEFFDGFKSLTIDIDGSDYWVFASIEQEYYYL